MLQQINNLNLPAGGLHQPHLLLQLYIHFISFFQNSIKCTLNLTLRYFEHQATYSFWEVQAISGGLCPRPPTSEIHNWVYPSPSEHPRSAPQFIIIILGVLAIWTSPKCYLSIFDVNCLPEFKFVLYSTEGYTKAITLNAPMFNLSMNLHSLQLPSS